MSVVWMTMLCVSWSMLMIRFSGCSLFSASTGSHASENRKTAFAGVPFLADLVFDRQAAGSRGASPRVFLTNRLWLVDVPDEVLDRGLLAHMTSLRAFRCFRHFSPPEMLLLDVQSATAEIVHRFWIATTCLWRSARTARR